MMSDCGMFAVYFGCDPADNNRCIELVNDELQQIATTPLTHRALEAAKKQYLGQLIVASDNNEQMALNNGRATLFLRPDPLPRRNQIPHPLPHPRPPTPLRPPPNPHPRLPTNPHLTLTHIHPKTL